MIKTLLIYSLVLFSSPAFSQDKKVEQAIADTACKCINKIDINLSNAQIDKKVNDCLVMALNKNDKLIKNSYSNKKNQAHEEGVDKGKQLAAKVYNILVTDCKKYSQLVSKLNQK